MNILISKNPDLLTHPYFGEPLSQTDGGICWAISTAWDRKIQTR